MTLFSDNVNSKNGWGDVTLKTLVLVSPPTALTLRVNVYSVTNPLSSKAVSDGGKSELLTVKSTKSKVSKTTVLFSDENVLIPLSKIMAWL